VIFAPIELISAFDSTDLKTRLCPFVPLDNFSFGFHHGRHQREFGISIHRLLAFFEFVYW